MGRIPHTRQTVILFLMPLGLGQSVGLRDMPKRDPVPKAKYERTIKRLQKEVERLRTLLKITNIRLSLIESERSQKEPRKSKPNG